MKLDRDRPGGAGKQRSDEAFSDPLKVWPAIVSLSDPRNPKEHDEQWQQAQNSVQEELSIVDVVAGKQLGE